MTANRRQSFNDQSVATLSSRPSWRSIFNAGGYNVHAQLRVAAVWNSNYYLIRLRLVFY